jgi:GT2 family glycosyltransferase
MTTLGERFGGLRAAYSIEQPLISNPFAMHTTVLLASYEMSDLAEGPLWLNVVDIDPLPSLRPPKHTPQGAEYVGAHLLLRLHGQPIAELILPIEQIRVEQEELHERLTDLAADAIDAHLQQDEQLSKDFPAESSQTTQQWPCAWSSRMAALGPVAPKVSIVLATYDRPQRLLRTLQTLAAQTYPVFEVLVVDNCPDRPGAATAIERINDRRFRLLVEERPGTSYARNTGLGAADTDIVAFTDDDVDADPDWLGNLVVPFYEDPTTACVTGLILPQRLDTPAELMFEKFGGFSKGLIPRSFTLNDNGHGRLYPYNVGLFGSGACAAFRRSVFLDLGGFALDLGPATIARGGEDLDAYLSVLHAGYRLHYSPAAMVRHESRTDINALARQIYSYGVGVSAMITRRMLNSPAERRAVARIIPVAMKYTLASDSPKNAKKIGTYPRHLDLYELAGLMYGPLAYLRSRRRQRRRLGFEGRDEESWTRCP